MELLEPPTSTLPPTPTPSVALPCAPVECAEPEVGVGDERPHAELLGKRRRVLIQALRGFCLCRVSGRLDFTQKP